MQDLIKDVVLLVLGGIGTAIWFFWRRRAEQTPVFENIQKAERLLSFQKELDKTNYSIGDLKNLESALMGRAEVAKELGESYAEEAEELRKVEFNKSMTQTELNVFASQAYQRSERKLESTIAELKKYYSPNEIERFDETNNAWRDYQLKYAEFISSQYKGGSIYNLIYASALESLTIARIVELETELKRSKETLVTQDILHWKEKKLKWSHGPSALTTINERINAGAQKRPKSLRVLYFDIAYPIDAHEFTDLDGNAVMLVTAFSHNKRELPLKRVYVNSGGKKTELKIITFMLSIENSISLAAKTFGQYRMDGIYLFPLYFKAQSGNIAADFAKNRDGFVLSELGNSDKDKIEGLPLTPPTGKGPSPDILQRVIAREFPGFKLPYLMEARST
ncbi:MAG: lysozyme inhibitor LprI family protein [Thermodesulfobacteriota bacterium]